MSKFLTPPIWYDKNGNLNQMLTGNAASSSDIAIGSTASASGSGIAIRGSASLGGIAIGGGADSGGIAIGGSADSGGMAIGENASALSGIAIGPNASVSTSNSIAIGRYASAGGTGSIAIGVEASTNTSNTIQLGDNAIAYKLSVGNGRMSLNIGSTAEGNWVSATSSGISQGLYLVRYGVGSYINTVYLMAPISVVSDGSTAKNDWYFPFYISPMRINTGSANPVVANSYYLKVGKNSTASNLQITPGYYRYDSGASPTFVNMSDGAQVTLFKIL